MQHNPPNSQILTALRQETTTNTTPTEEKKSEHDAEVLIGEACGSLRGCAIKSSQPSMWTPTDQPRALPMTKKRLWVLNPNHGLQVSALHHPAHFGGRKTGRADHGATWFDEEGIARAREQH